MSEIRTMSVKETKERSVHDMVKMGLITTDEARKAMDKIRSEPDFDGSITMSSVKIDDETIEKIKREFEETVRTDFKTPIFDDDFKIDVAKGSALDRLAESFGVKRRTTDESDSELRDRVKVMMEVKDEGIFADPTVGLNWVEGPQVNDCFTAYNGTVWVMTTEGPKQLDSVETDPLSELSSEEADAIRYSIAAKAKEDKRANIIDMLEKI